MSKITMIFMILGLVGVANCAKWTARFKTYIVTHRQEVFMTCEVNGIFVGFYNSKGTKIDSDGTKYKISGDSKNKMLEILDVNEEDYGEYKCKDESSEDVGTLEVSVTVDDLKDQSLAVGFEGTIQAEVYGMPRKPIKWYFKDKIIAALDQAGKMTYNQDNRYEINSRGSLMVKNVQAADAGKYKIQVTLEQSRINKEATIEVGVKPSIKAAPEKSYTKTAGQTLKMSCSYAAGDANPTWIFTDRKNKVKTIDAARIDQTGYTIQNVSASDEGNYTCSAKNKFGETMVKTEIALVITPAKITTDFKDMKIEISKKFDISCEADGVPSPTVTILYAEKSVATGKGSTMLSITMAKENIGNYKCTADNGATDKDGNSLAVKKSMELVMLTPPSIDKVKSTKAITSAIGRSYTFICIASGNPQPRLVIKQAGKEVTKILSNKTGQVIQAIYKVEAKGDDDFKAIVCNVDNAYGNDTLTVAIKKVVKAKAPTDIEKDGKAGLTYIDLKWTAVKGADKYIVYVNDTRYKDEPKMPMISIQNLLQNSYYGFKVASINLAGVGNASAPVFFMTSDITPPSKVNDVISMDVTYKSAVVQWDPPKNVEGLDISYRITYCQMNNDTKVKCFKTEGKDASTILKDLKSGSVYEVEIVAVNQNVEGEKQTYEFTTKEYVPTVAPAPSDKSKGIAAGAIAGIIIAIILIILLVVDLFCCFFNHCGFTHCCVETFCPSKSTKYMPTDTKEVEEKKELKPKAEQAAENVV